LVESQLALALKDNKRLKEDLEVLKSREEALSKDANTLYENRYKSLENNLTAQISQLKR